MKIPSIIEQTLKETGLPWEIQKGTKHYHIKVNNMLVGILPKGSKEAKPRTIKNCVSQIKKAAKDIPWNSYHSAQQ